MQLSNIAVSRLFSIIVTLFILVLVYLWIGHIANRDEPSVEPPSPAATSLEQQPSGTVPDEDKETVKMEEETDSAVEEDEPESSQPEVPEKSEKPVATGGSHLVIVGNFLERANAEKHLATVKSLGYPSSEILQFEISQYYTVCAGRYNDPTEARRIAKKIKEQHGIDAYMRTVN